MRISLDTSAYSAFMRGHDDITDRIQRAETIALSLVTLAELIAGFRSGSRYRENLAGLTRFRASPRVEVVPFGEDTARCYAEIYLSLRQAGTPIPTNDIWIAASAMEHGLVVVTTDPHFKRVIQVRTECFEVKPHD